MKWMFKEDHSLEHRCVESAKIRAKYPDRVPVIVEKVSGSQIVDIDKRKYLVPSDITVAQFMWIIRKRIQLPSEKAIFLFVDKTVPQSRVHSSGHCPPTSPHLPSPAGKERNPGPVEARGLQSRWVTGCVPISPAGS
ncbi:gamma-aminobutyric acid receptor-associated protein-like 2 isoform X1 [Acinonyx jubatus]|uniref:Gamma-aminobutyric acid receptor-associated protein-like 2 isoform X1 n=1 Tax=Acinonyx jubatus TaxID=32536 RepID=A0ABM3P5U3_ACIJB|nr:gamma-aminobutyric acid receptor-associated protein-like 2 isoform X1 [Acinonyx jubatus]